MLTAEQKQHIAGRLRLGVSLELAGQELGLTIVDVERALDDDPDFRKAVVQANAQAKVKAHAYAMRDAGEGDRNASHFLRTELASQAKPKTHAKLRDWKPPPAKKGETFLTRELAAEMVYLFGRGYWNGEVAKRIGIGGRTLRDWREKGRKAQAKAVAGDALTETEQLFADLEHSIIFVKQEFMGHSMERLRESDEWRAHLAILERLFPKRFGLQINMKLDAELEAATKTLRENLHPSVYAIALRAMNGEDCRAYRIAETVDVASAADAADR